MYRSTKQESLCIVSSRPLVGFNKLDARRLQTFPGHHSRPSWSSDGREEQTKPENICHLPSRPSRPYALSHLLMQSFGAPRAGPLRLDDSGVICCAVADSDNAWRAQSGSHLSEIERKHA